MGDLRARIERIDRGFAEVDEVALRAAVLAALRLGFGCSIDLANIATRVSRALGIATDDDLQALRSAGILGNGDATSKRLTATVLELCRAGLGFPEFQGEAVSVLHVTESGRRALVEGEPPHPLTDAYGGGLAGLPDEVLARLEDAANCYRFALLRPAVVMVGVAYEHAVDVTASGLGIKAPQYAPRLEKLRQRVQNASGGDGVAATRRQAIQALSVASLVAEQRNLAGHPKPHEPAAPEVEDLVWKAPHWLRSILGIPTWLVGNGDANG